MLDTTMLLACGMIDETVRLSQQTLYKIISLPRKLLPQKREAKSLMLRQFSLQWIIHNVPLQNGILLTYEEFLTAIRRFGKFYHEHNLEDQLHDFYETAVQVWQKFKAQPTTEEIKHALLEIAAKTLDNDLRKQQILSTEVGLGEGLFKIAKEFYIGQTLPSQSSLVAKVFSNLEGILQHENHIIDACHDYYGFLRDFIHVHFPAARSQDGQQVKQTVDNTRNVCLGACTFAIGSYLKLLGYPLQMIETIIDQFLSSSTQAIVASNFQQQRLSVSADSFQALQLQVKGQREIGIKGFLLWKRILNGYKVSEGYALAQRANSSFQICAILNEVQLLLPRFNPRLIQVRALKDFFELKVKQSLIKNKEQIKIYHGRVKNNWVLFKIKSINQLRLLVRILAENFEQLNVRSNKVYQEALEYIRNKKKIAIVSRKESQRQVQEDQLELDQSRTEEDNKLEEGDISRIQVLEGDQENKEEQLQQQ